MMIERGATVRKVRIVYVPDAERRGPDRTRIGTVEEHDDAVARQLVAGGAAVYVDDDQPAEDETPQRGEETQPAWPAVIQQPGAGEAPPADVQPGADEGTPDEAPARPATVLKPRRQGLPAAEKPADPAAK